VEFGGGDTLVIQGVTKLFKLRFVLDGQVY
jgi:hypothetical protein